MIKTVELENQTKTYRDIEYTISVKYVNTGPKKIRSVIVSEPRAMPDIYSVRTTEDLNPQSIWPWRDPEPVSKNAQVEKTEQMFKTKIDNHYDGMEQASR